MSTEKLETLLDDFLDPAIWYKWAVIQKLKYIQLVSVGFSKEEALLIVAGSKLTKVA